MKKTKTIAFALIVLLAAAILLAACGSPEPEDETAYITISLGGGASRAAVPWNTDIDDEAIPHDIKIGNTIVATGLYITNDEKAVLTRSVSAGTHKVEVRGYDPSDKTKLISYAEETVTVTARQTTTCEMKMSQAFETSTTPWNDAIAAIKAGGGNDRACYIFVNKDDTGTGIPANSAANTFSNSTIVDIIRVFISGDHTITLSGTGSLLKIYAGQTVTLRGAHLKGNSGNDTPLVLIDGGTFTMENGTISDNIAGGSSGGGVRVNSGFFNMSCGTISGNKLTNNVAGGGVNVTGGKFTMTGGTISDNTAGSGGGVYVHTPATFDMSGGAISDNTAIGNYGMGGGVDSDGTFTMSGTALITKNEATSMGGGVSSRGTFTMSGTALITKNEATNQGGGVFGGGNFRMEGGTISVNNAIAGGGVFVNSGTFTMTGGTISTNTATNTGTGGGVFIYTGAVFDMSGTAGISGNTSDYAGGGVYLGGASGGSQTFNLEKLELVHNNTATNKGNQVHVSEDGTFKVGGSTFGDYDAINFTKN